MCHLVSGVLGSCGFVGRGQWWHSRFGRVPHQAQRGKCHRCLGLRRLSMGRCLDRQGRQLLEIRCISSFDYEWMKFWFLVGLYSRRLRSAFWPLNLRFLTFWTVFLIFQVLTTFSINVLKKMDTTRVIASKIFQTVYFLPSNPNLKSRKSTVSTTFYGFLLY